MAALVLVVVVSNAQGATQRNLVEQGTGSEGLTGCTGQSAGGAPPASWVAGRTAGPDAAFSGKCTFEFSGTVQGRPIANGIYDGTITVNFNRSFPNGLGGFCWKFTGNVTIANRAGTSSFDEKVTGKVCEVGADQDPTAVTFAGSYAITGGTGSLAGASGRGRLTVNDDEQGNDFWFQVGHIVA